MQFPKFDGQNPKIWKDNCLSYFELYQLPEGMWITAAHLHFERNAAKWYQAYRQNHTFKNWDHFYLVVEEEFGSDDFRTTMNALLDLEQTGPLKITPPSFKLYNMTLPCTTLTMMSYFSCHNTSDGLRRRSGVQWSLKCHKQCRSVNHCPDSTRYDRKKQNKIQLGK